MGNLVRVVLLPGQRYDTIGVAPLIEGIKFNGLIADKAFNANWIIAEPNQRGAKIPLSQKVNRTAPPGIDREVDKWWHRIENFLCKLQGIQESGNAKLQDRQQLRGPDLSWLRIDQLTINLNRP